jgi:predicted  nucleic acid-binding Zn-ribbon protein
MGVTFDYQLEVLQSRVQSHEDRARALDREADHAASEVDELEARLEDARVRAARLESRFAEALADLEDAKGALAEYEHLNEAYDELFPGSA